MDFDFLDLVVSENVAQFQSTWEETLNENNIDKFTDTERSEAYEKLGTAQFYHGNYKEAIENLEIAIGSQYLPLKTNRSITFVKSTLANLYCRLGQYDKSEALLSAVLAKPDEEHYDLIPIMQSNLAVVYLHLGKEKEAEIKAKEAILSAAQMLDKTSYEYLNHVRVLLSVYIRSGQLEKAESLLAENAFSDIERNVLIAGIKFASGDSKAALSILSGEQFRVNSPEHQVQRQRRVAEQLESTGDYHLQEEFDRAVLASMISFNLSVMDEAERDQHLTDALCSIEEVVTQLRMRRYEINEQAKAQQSHSFNPHNPYLRCKWDEHPNFMPFDQYFYPITTLTTLLGVRAENSLLSEPLSIGVDIQTGLVPIEMHKLDQILDEVNAQFSDSIGAVTMSLLDKDPSSSQIVEELIVRAPDSVTDDANVLPLLPTVDEHPLLDDSVSIPGSFAPAAIDPVGSKQQPGQEAQQQQSKVGSKGGGRYSSSSAEETHSSADYPDLSLLKDTLRSHRLLHEMKHGDYINGAVVAATSQHLLSSYNVNVSNKTGQIIPPAVVAAVQKGKKKNAKNGDTASKRRGSKDGTDTKTLSSIASAGGDSLPGTSRSSGDTSVVPEKKKKGVHAVEAVAAPVPYHYVPEKHDKTSIRSEIMLLVDKFGSDEAANWIQWALASCGGISFGVMGQSVPNPREVVGFNMEHKAEDGSGAPPSEQFLYEVRNRLLHVDSLLQPTFNGDAYVYLQGKLEARVLVTFALVKITVQLTMKPETSALISQLQEVCGALRAKLDCNESRTYCALAVRHKYDFEEWCINPLLTDEALLSHLVLTMLPIAKKYLAESSGVSDVQIKRDALKRAINLYTSIGRIPQYAGGAKFPPVSMEQLQAIPPHVVEENEKNNLEWVQMYGQLRALSLMRTMKSLGSQAGSTTGNKV